MTVIVYDGRELAADSGAWSSVSQQKVPFPKITRAPDGSLVAMAGKLSDAWWLREWVLSGMSPGTPPEFQGKDDEAPYIALVKPDGTMWFAKGNVRFSPMPFPAAVGAETPCAFCEGAMAAGASAGEAVALAAVNCEAVLGPVQIERLVG